MKVIALLALIALSSGAQATDGQRRAECHHECFSCETRCRHAPEFKSCKNTCLELKKACCQAASSGPGPNTTCDCS
jgi:hypothetical protein